VRIDVVSIFPDYFAPLELSLPGKARDGGLLDLHVHDLRGWTHDRHRTVDDTPYGGGAGMVMKPEPWGEALDEQGAPGAVLEVPTPAGEPFSQAVATGLAGEDHLHFACVRFVGLEQRGEVHHPPFLVVRVV
jgi:tRNA (guanine37-N1)-methyltransferase